MKLEPSTILNVIVGMIVWTILNALFLGDIIGKVTGSFEQLG